jgi:UDP-N-acetylglucosamine diphosphorylase/glucosamine-1-phosphate N-acetyltransferase
VTLSLYLLDPVTPDPTWAPFLGVRPICELLAGACRIRERWEAGLDTDTTAILSDCSGGFDEGAVPPVGAMRAVEGPAIVAAGWFAPRGAIAAPVEGIRRLVHQRETVAWVVAAGERWDGPHRDGAEAAIDGERLRGAFDLITALEKFLPSDCAGMQPGDRDPVPQASVVLGDPSGVVSLGALVEPGVVFDVRQGPVVLEQGVEVRHGTRLEGPLFAGAHSRLLGGFLRTSVFGPRTVVRGEVSSSLFLGYANKAHDGYVGHSVIGHWVNLGAGTTTSNLKNTYGPVSIEVTGKRIDTGRQFLGSIIGDHVKTAIGTMLGTGTVVSLGAHLFGAAPVPRYVPPFAWGNQGSERLDEEGFLRIAERVLPRREVEFTPARRAYLSATYRRRIGG